MNNGTYPRRKCRHCGEPVATNAINRHEAMCAKASDEEREHRTTMRSYKLSERRPVAKPKRPYHHHKRNALALLSVNNGRKLNVTLSLPVSVLMQLLPTINLERIEVS